jgi:acetolactate synthase-1/2/3 large subunit
MGRTVADVIASMLVEKGARHVFLLPGGVCAHLVDAVERHPELITVPMLHEGSAGIAAEAYAQYAGDLGVAVVTSGPGSTNILTAVAAAYTDSVPLIVLAGQVKTADLHGQPMGRQFGSQHVDMARVVRPIVKHFCSIERPEDCLDEIGSAIELARTGRPGPVWVQVPLDIQGIQVPAQDRLPQSPASPIPTTEDMHAFASAFATALVRARKPCVLLGNGCRTSGEADEVRAVMRELGLPILLTWKTVDFLADSDPLLVGRPGALAPWHANLVQQSCDLLLILGTRLDHGQVGHNLANLAPNAEVFRVEIDVDEAAKWSDPRVHVIVADVADFIPHLWPMRQAATSNPEIAGWRKQVQSLREALPVPRAGLSPDPQLSIYEVVDRLSDSLPDDAVIVSGSSGQAIEVFLQCFRAKEGQRILCSAALGSMGFGLAGAVGVHFAAGGAEVWCIEGDGSVAMSITDLAAIGARRLPIRIILLDNQGYLSIRMSQQVLASNCGFDRDTGLPLPEWNKVLPALGFETVDVMDLAQLAAAVSQQCDGPQVIRVHLRSHEVSYPKVYTQVLANGSFVTSALDDMRPALADMYPKGASLRD